MAARWPSSEPRRQDRLSIMNCTDNALMANTSVSQPFQVLHIPAEVFAELAAIHMTDPANEAYRR
jgi:hypothetical protein